MIGTCHVTAYTSLGIYVSFIHSLSLPAATMYPSVLSQPFTTGSNDVPTPAMLLLLASVAILLQLRCCSPLLHNA
jgi:hypothetical protein